MSDNVESDQGLPHEPLGDGYEPQGDELTPQEAVDRINCLRRVAQRECYLPEDPDKNNRNAGRVRALAQVITLLERAGLHPDDGAVEFDETVEEIHDV